MARDHQRSVGRPLRFLRASFESRQPGEEGMGLFEIILAFVVLVTVMVPVSYVLTNALGQAANAREKITAIGVAEQWIETLNYSGPPVDSNNLPTTGSWFTNPSNAPTLVSPTVVSNISYSVTAMFNWTTQGSTSGTPDLCTVGISPVLDLQVKVSWGSSQSITESSLLNFPPSGVVTDGYLGVQVNGDPSTGPPNDAGSVPWSTRVTGVPIKITGTALTSPSSYTINPSSNGCAFIQLPPGSYTVVVGTGPSNYTTAFVANYNEGSSQTTSGTSVNVAQITQLTYQYDEGSLVDLQYPATTVTEDGVVCPNLTSALCLSTGQTPTSTSSPSVSPVASGVVKTSSGWSTATFPSTFQRVNSTSCTSKLCIAVGYGSGTNPTAISQSASPTTWTTTNDTFPSGTGITALTNVVCPASTSTVCFAIGTSPTSNKMILQGTISGSSAPYTLTWAVFPAVSGVTLTTASQIVCPSTTDCFVRGATASAPVTLSTTNTGTSWTNVTLPNGTTAVSQISCTTTKCFLVGAKSSTPVIDSVTLAGTSWTSQTVPGSPTSLSQINCVSGTTCFVIGVNSSTPMIISSTNGTTWTSDTLASGTTAVTQMTCASTTVCYTVAANSSGLTVMSLSGTTWSNTTLPSGLAVTQINQVVCTSTTICFASGTNSTSPFIMSLSSATAWTKDTLSVSSGLLGFISGLACYGSVCEASAGTSVGPTVLEDTSAVVGANTFTSVTMPSGLSGMMIDNPPILLSNSNLQPSSPLALTAPTTAVAPLASIGPIFPFASSSAIALGECASEISNASATIATSPGGTTTAGTFPLGLLPMEAEVSGAAVSGETVTISDNCSPALSPISGTTPTTYSMPSTDVDGLSRADVVYSVPGTTPTTYTISFTGTYSASVTVSVFQTYVTCTGSACAVATTYLPGPVVVNV